MQYDYSRRKPKTLNKAIDLLEKELRHYRGGKISSSEEKEKEHPLHFAIRQVESYRQRRSGAIAQRQVGARKGQFGSLAPPAHLMWYSLLDHSRYGRRAFALRCRDRLLEMLDYIKAACVVRISRAARDYFVPMKPVDPATLLLCNSNPAKKDDSEILTRGR